VNHTVLTQEHTLPMYVHLT